MNPRLLARFLALLLTGSLAHANGVADLGDGISYLAATDLATIAELPPGPAIVDARASTPPAPGSRSALATWLADGTSPRVVLLDEQTGEAWAGLIAALPAGHRTLTLAPQSADFPSDLRVAVSPADTAAALAALRHGTPAADLAQPEVMKRRFDEARLIRRYYGVDEPEAPGDADERAAAGPRERDDMLVRARQILAGLQALGRG